jgi:hypothetical protein
MRREPKPESNQTPALLKPMDVKRMARVPYATVIQWLTVGHARAGLLRSMDLAENGKRHSYRIRREDWDAFLARLQAAPREQHRPKPRSRPATAGATKGMFSTKPSGRWLA